MRVPVCPDRLPCVLFSRLLKNAEAKPRAAPDTAYNFSLSLGRHGDGVDDNDYVDNISDAVCRLLFRGEIVVLVKCAIHLADSDLAQGAYHGHFILESAKWISHPIGTHFSSLVVNIKVT